MDLLRNVKRESYCVTVAEMREHLEKNPHLALKTCDRILKMGEKQATNIDSIMLGTNMRHLEADIMEDMFGVGENQKLIEFTPSNDAGFAFGTVETKLD